MTTDRGPLLTRLWTHLVKHARPWISKLEPKEPGIGAVGISFEYEWPDAAKTLSESETAPRVEEANQRQKND